MFEAQRYIEKGPEENNYILPLVSMLTHIRTKGVITIIEEKDEKNLKRDLSTLKSKNNVCMSGRRSSLSALVGNVGNDVSGHNFQHYIFSLAIVFFSHRRIQFKDSDQKTYFEKVDGRVKTLREGFKSYINYFRGILTVVLDCHTDTHTLIYNNIYNNSFGP